MRRDGRDQHCVASQSFPHSTERHRRLGSLVRRGRAYFHPISERPPPDHCCPFRQSTGSGGVPPSFRCSSQSIVSALPYKPGIGRLSPGSAACRPQPSCAVPATMASRRSKIRLIGAVSAASRPRLRPETLVQQLELSCAWWASTSRC